MSKRKPPRLNRKGVEAVAKYHYEQINSHPWAEADKTGRKEFMSWARDILRAYLKATQEE